jgi:predicted transcriptional regulator
MRQHGRVTTKERLLELAESLDEAAVERVLIFTEADMEPPRPLMDDERASVLRGLAQLEAGQYVSSGEVFAEYDLD